MSVTLSVANNGSRSVTITAAGATGLITVNAGRWTGGYGVQTWGDLGTIASPGGTLTVTLPAFGFYFFMATTATGEISNPFTMAVPNDDTDYLTQCQDGIAETIKRLNLPDIEQRVFTQMVPNETEVTYPCVFVLWEDGTDAIMESDDAGGMNSTTLVGHSVRVLFAVRGVENDEELRAILAKNRQRIWSAFDMQRLVDVPKVSYCKAKFARRIRLFTFNPNGMQDAIHMIATALTITPYVRQPRGNQ